MIDAISETDLRNLAQTHADYCVSIYLPTARIGPGSDQVPIRLKNLVGSARKELEELGLKRSQIDNLLAPVAELKSDHDLLKSLDRGLAIFVSADRVFSYRLQREVDEVVVVTDRFHLKPLIPSVAGETTFHILAISQNRVRLLRGDRYGVAELTVSDVPSDMAQALAYDDREAQLHSHGARKVGAGRVSATFHGHGGIKDTTGADLDRFLGMVASGVAKVIDDPKSPTVLAGVDELVSRFRAAKNSLALVDEAVKGNSDTLDTAELHRRAWPLVEKEFDRTRSSDVDWFEAHPDVVQSDIGEVVSAAGDGRIECLFVPVGVRQWGIVDSENRAVLNHEARQPGDHDLLDVAAVETILRRGRVYVVAPDSVPGGGVVAARLRY